MLQLSFFGMPVLEGKGLILAFLPQILVGLIEGQYVDGIHDQTAFDVEIKGRISN